MSVLSTGLVLAVGPLGDELEPVCPDQQSDQDGCWQTVANRSECHAWVSYPSLTVSAEPTATCADGRLTGSALTAGRNRYGRWTMKGNFSKGLKSGTFVRVWDDGGSVTWTYADGKIHGPSFWEPSEAMEITYYGIGDRLSDIETQTENYVNGVLDGPQTTMTRDGGSHTGTYADGERDGLWTSEYPDGESHTGTYADGKGVGLWTSKYPGGGSRTGTYADGKRDGPWTWKYPQGRSHTVTFVDGIRHGLAAWTSANGERHEGRWVAGAPRDGTFRVADRQGRTLVEATFADGLASALSVPGVELPPGTPPPDGKSSVDGAFGISFGPRGVEQLSSLTCWDEDRDDGGEYDYSNPRPCMTDLAARFLEGWRDFTLRDVPSPVAGMFKYSVEATADAGVVSLAGHFRLGTEDPNPKTMTLDDEWDEWFSRCKELENTIRRLLADKYDECRYLDDEGSPTSTLGQCDRSGLPERTIWLHSCHELKYEVVSSYRRAQMIKARRKYGVPSAAEL